MATNSSLRAKLTNYLLGQHSSSTFGRNYVKNSMAIQNTANVTANGSATVTRNTSSPLTGIADFSITLPNNATDYVEWALDTLDNSTSGQNCELRFDYNASSLGSVVQAQVLQGGTLVNTALLNTNNKSVYVNVPCGAVPSTTVRVANGTGNSGTSSLKVANVTYGKATNVGSVSTAQFIGSAFIPFNGSCTWSRTNTALGPFTTNSACPGPTVETNPGPGTIQTTDADLPRFTVNNLPPGTYQVTMGATMTAGASATKTAFAINDGTDTRGQIGGYNQNGQYAPTQVIAYFTYTTAGNRSFEMYASAESNSVSITNNAAQLQVSFSITRFPSSTEVVIKPDQQDYDWTSYTPTFVGIGTPSAVTCKHKREGSDLLVDCKYTTGTVTATTMQISLPTGLTMDSTKLASGVSLHGIYARNAAATGLQLIVDSSDLTNFRVSTATGLSAALGNSINSGEIQSFSARVPISGWTQTNSAPLLVGSVTSNTSSAERIERVSVLSTCSGSPCTISSQSGSWLSSITRNGSGDYTLNIASGIFSAAPTCTIAISNTSGPIASRHLADPTTTAVRFVTVNNVFAATDSSFQVICMGPRV